MIEAAPLTPLGAFALGYLVLVATPGPNLLAVATLATLRGFRGVLPLCWGIATGAAALTATLLLVAAVVPRADGIESAGRLIGAALLAAIALRIARLPRPGDGAAASAASVTVPAVFAAGFVTAAANPVTAAFLAAQFLGPMADQGAAVTTILLVPGVALGVNLAVATLLSRRHARNMLLARHRAICLVAAGTLLFVAGSAIAPLLAG